MKVFMLWDMEGTSGLLHRDQAWYWDEGVPEEAGREGKRLLTADINSAVQAALSAGADEVIVCDTHHGGGNIRLEDMLTDPRVTYLCKSRGPEGGIMRWLPGLNETVDAFMVPGHHAKAGTPGAFLPHTWTLAWADFRINGLSVGEMGIEACFAGHWGVPVALAQGERTACREAEGMFPGIVTACVKEAVDHDTCTGPAAADARALTAEKVAEAVAGIGKGRFQPFQPELPMTVEVTMKSAEDVEKALRRPGVEQVDDRTVRGVVQRRCDVVKWLLGTGVPCEEAQ